MTLELGVYSFGDTPRTTGGGFGPTSQAVRDALEAVQLADQVGLDFFGFGEHHTRSMPLASPTPMVTAAAATTQRIKIGTAVTVLSTDDPIRVFEQLAVADAIAPGRIPPPTSGDCSTPPPGPPPRGCTINPLSDQPCRRNIVDTGRGSPSTASGRAPAVASSDAS